MAASQRHFPRASCVPRSPVGAGFTATVFACGCTGWGKTHTISGTDREPGILPRAVRRLLFHRLLQPDAKAGSDKAFVVFLTCRQRGHGDSCGPKLERAENTRTRRGACQQQSPTEEKRAEDPPDPRGRLPNLSCAHSSTRADRHAFSDALRRLSSLGIVRLARERA